MGHRQGPMEGMVIDSLMPNPNFWRGKNVLVTGHSGFKGAWLCFWLLRMGAKVTGVSLPPVTLPNLFDLAGLESHVKSHWVDVRSEEEIQKIFDHTQPDIVLHLAAQALVRPSYAEPASTFSTNILGTLNVLEASRKTPSVRSIVAVTTDKVYKNHEGGLAFRESDPLGGCDPYSASKAGAEMVIASYRKSFFAPAGVGLAAARAGNVIGGGDWSVDRILPDAVRAWSGSMALVVRNPRATRPWQHVLEPLNGYLGLAQKIFESPKSACDFNFGPDPQKVATVQQVATLARAAFGRGDISWEEGTGDLHEALTLTLDNSKAKVQLGHYPVWKLETAIARTMEWYRLQLEGQNATCLCEGDVHFYLSGT